MEHYALSEEDCNQMISDLSLEDIARSSCRKWRDLPSRLVLPGILVEDIDRSGTGEGEKRLNFFREWKQMRGFDATYKRLIGALLDIRCREDAEFVCRLVRDKHTRHSGQWAASEKRATGGDGSGEDSGKPSSRLQIKMPSWP